MSFRSTYDLATVQAFVDSREFGDPINPARVTFLGDGAGSVVGKIYGVGLVDPEYDEDGVLTNPDGAKRWLEADQVIEGEVIEHPDGSLSFKGISRHLVETVGLTPGQASIRYEIKPRDCASCR